VLKRDNIFIANLYTFTYSYECRLTGLIYDIYKTDSIQIY